MSDEKPTDLHYKYVDGGYNPEPATEAEILALPFVQEALRKTREETYQAAWNAGWNHAVFCYEPDED